MSEIVLLIVSYNAFPRNQRGRRSPTSVCWLNAKSDGCQQLKIIYDFAKLCQPIKEILWLYHIQASSSTSWDWLFISQVKMIVQTLKLFCLSVLGFTIHNLEIFQLLNSPLFELWYFKEVIYLLFRNYVSSCMYVYMCMCSGHNEYI